MISTGLGDDGTTTLPGGKRVPKTSPEIECFGEMDELNSYLGLAVLYINKRKVKTIIEEIQKELFMLPPLMINGEDMKRDYVKKIEKRIAEMEKIIGSLRHFIIPGGSKGSAFLHIARTVSRRVERKALALNPKKHILIYLNRLSDLLFLLALYENKEQGKEEKEVRI